MTWRSVVWNLIVLCQSVSTDKRRTSGCCIRHLIFLGCIDVRMRKFGILAGIKIMLFKRSADMLSCDTGQLDTDNINDICWGRSLLCLYDAALIATGSALDAGMFTKPRTLNKKCKGFLKIFVATLLHVALVSLTFTCHESSKISFNFDTSVYDTAGLCAWLELRFPVEFIKKQDTAFASRWYLVGLSGARLSLAA